MFQASWTGFKLMAAANCEAEYCLFFCCLLFWLDVHGPKEGKGAHDGLAVFLFFVDGLLLLLRRNEYKEDKALYDGRALRSLVFYNVWNF